MPHDEDARAATPELPPRPSLDTLPIAGLTRRRVAVLVAGLIGIWLVGVFARQVSDASAAASQVDAMRARNETVSQQIASLQAEVDLVQRPEVYQELARGYRLGTAREIPFVVDPNAPPPPPGSPGSVGIAGAVSHEQRTPLEAWLQVLFGPESGQ